MHQERYTSSSELPVPQVPQQQMELSGCMDREECMAPSVPVQDLAPRPDQEILA